jgi:hypothetical protein
VFGNSCSSRCSNERSRRRDVERSSAVAAGAGSVDEVVALGPHREHVIAHRLGATRDLVRGLALESQRDEEAADLRRGRLSTHDLIHHLAGVVAAEVVAVE